MEEGAEGGFWMEQDRQRDIQRELETDRGCTMPSKEIHIYLYKYRKFYITAGLYQSVLCLNFNGNLINNLPHNHK